MILLEWKNGSTAKARHIDVTALLAQHVQFAALSEYEYDKVQVAADMVGCQDAVQDMWALA